MSRLTGGNVIEDSVVRVVGGGSASPSITLTTSDAGAPVPVFVRTGKSLSSFDAVFLSAAGLPVDSGISGSILVERVANKTATTLGTISFGATGALTYVPAAGGTLPVAIAAEAVKGDGLRFTLVSLAGAATVALVLGVA